MDPVSDASDFREVKSELERMNRLYDALSQINQAIVHLKTRQELFDKVCEVAVELGGFRLAYVGWVDSQTLQVVPVAKYGNHTAFLDTLPMRADTRPQGLGPTGQAIRSGRPYICNDYFNDPATEPWRAAAAEHGFRSSGTFPIRQEDRITGVFGVYAGEVDFFHDKEAQLIEEAAGDISFALDNFLREERRGKAEKSARRLAAIVESSLDAIISEDMEGTIQTWNAGAERMYGYRAEEAIGKPLFMLVPEDKREEAEKLLAAVRSGRSFSGVETEHLHKCGLRFPVSVTLSPVRDSAGAIIGISRIAHDISEQRASVDALRESTGLLQVLIQEAPTGLAMFDRDMRMLACSKRWKSDRGLNDIEVIGWTHAELEPSIPERWKQEERRALGGETIISPQDSYTRHDGQLRWLSRTLRPWMTGSGEIGGIVVLSEDITDRKLAEMALAEEVARTRLLFEKATDSMFLLDEEFKVVEANSRFAALLGRPLKEVYGLHPWDWDADRPTSGSLENLTAQVPTRPMTFEGRVKSLDGTVHEVEASTTPTEWGGRNLIFNVVRDITSRKQAEAARREAEQQLRQVIDSLDEGLFIINMEGELLSWNPAARHILGIPDKGFESVTLAQYPAIVTVFAPDGSVLPPEQWPLVRAMRGEHIQNQEYRTRSKYLEEDRMISYSSSVVDCGDGRKLAFLRCQDVTARWRAEQQVRESQSRLKALIDTIQFGLLVADMEGNLLDWNLVVERMLGFAKDNQRMHMRDFLGLVELFSLDGKPLPQDQWPMGRLMRGEEVSGLELRVRLARSGQEFMLRYHGSIVPYEKDKKLIMIQFQDITGQLQAGADS